MGLKDKASKIDFASIMPAAQPVPDASKPKTAPGAMMAFANDQRSELLRENEELRIRVAQVGELEGRLSEVSAELRSWDGALPARSIDTAEIARSEFANRHESAFVGKAFEDFKREIQEAGRNSQPIKVRAIAKPGEGPKYELVFGHRRYEACRQLGIPVWAVVENLDDRALVEEMDRENRGRADPSPWEQGMTYLRALERGVYPSNRQMAAALGVDISNLGKALTLARLPEAVIAAFPTPQSIQLAWATELGRAFQEDEAGLVVRAQALVVDKSVHSAKSVFARLVSPPTSSAEATPPIVQASHALKHANQKVGAVKFDALGRPSMRLSVKLSEDQQQALLKAMQGFVDSL
ncbi:ParB/RepB/Spo0J family partition protein [Variovorax guangxiensis]|uniref:ParB/RepB/Spo0J family partition protein n=1 Tax=Variovorax guangxiensis TaxID=1775474 RepID=UPI0028585FD8|nr:ParB/RepB/Spo0J family partition protein [Variovorax guangxiensis]MDR6855817.1 ParB family chromosome partitioning protein [Variovorax guangxiensis]